MIGSEWDASLRQGVFRAVTKFVGFLSRNQSPPLQIVQVRVEPNPPQSHDHPQVLQSFQFAFQKRSAVGEFRRQRLVIGRRATSSGGYIKTGQLLSIVAGG